MSLGSMEQRTKGMKKQAQELIEFAYQRGVKAGHEEMQNQMHEHWEKKQKELIEQGRNEAWEAARKIAIENTVPFEEWDLLKIGNSTLAVFNKYSASEAIERIRAYEEQKKKEDKIKVGDEVRWLINTDCIGIVTYVDYQNNMIWIMGHDGRHFIGGSHEIEKYEKTGRTFQEIAEVLKKMKEGE